MWQLVILSLVICVTRSYQSSDHLDVLSDSLLHDFMRRLGSNQNLQEDYNEYNDDSVAQSPQIRVAKDYDMAYPFRFQTRDDLLLPHAAVPRKEYLEHSSLWGHQYMQGGAGEGQQRLKPDGSMKNIQVIKTDAVLPAYCNPPNPCPLGFTADDGCLEEFENTATFSREYQASQDCMCDNEHMFDCPGNNDENELETLARSIQNEGIMDSTLDKISKLQQQPVDHKVVAKKFFSKKSHDDSLGELVSKAKREGVKANRLSSNPLLDGEKLPIVAKKSPHLAHGDQIM